MLSDSNMYSKCPHLRPPCFLGSEPARAGWTVGLAAIAMLLGLAWRAAAARAEPPTSAVS